MSDAIASVGTQFRRYDPSTTSWVRQAEVLSINGPTKTRETIDVTNLDSTGGYREFIASFRDGGTVQLSMNFTRTTYEQMNDDFEDDEAKNYEIVLPDAETTTLEFVAFVTDLPLAIAVGNQVTADVTLKVTGQPVLNSGSGS